jgi:hypothetical protein
VSPNPFLTPGTYSIVASYSGDASFNPSTSAAANFTVTKGQTSTTTSLAPCYSAGGLCTTSLGTDVTLSASVANNNSVFSQLPTGTITFYLNGAQLGSPVAVDSSIIPPFANLSTNQLPLGQYSLTAQFSGDINYLGSTAPGSLIDVNIPTILVMNAFPQSPQPGQTVTISAQIMTSGVSGPLPAPTGTLQFTANGAVIGNSAINPSGLAQLTTNSLQGNPVIVYGAYSGDSNYGSSTSLVEIFTPDFVLSTNSNPPNIMISSPGSSGTATITVTEELGFKGTVNFSLTCPGTSTEISCGISPASVALTGTSGVPATLIVTTTAAGMVVPGARPTVYGMPRVEIIPICILSFVSILCLWRNPDLRRWKTAFGLLVLGCVLTSAGCGGAGGSGGGTGGGAPNPGTPPGTYSVGVTATSGNLSHTTITITVR